MVECVATFFSIRTTLRLYDPIWDFPYFTASPSLQWNDVPDRKILLQLRNH